MADKAPSPPVIRMNDFARQWADTREAALAAFEAVGASGWYILGREVEEFEKALASYWGIEQAIGVASGLDAIEIALKVAGCKPGDRVLTTPLTAFATTLAIVKAGGIPVFLDTDSFGLIDLDRCRDVLSSRRDIRFLVPVHLYGHSLDATKLNELRREFGCKIIEDCAQAIGSRFQGAPPGASGEMAATSFYPTKNLGAMGDGGAILTPSEEFAAAARTLRDYGQTARYRHDALGYNSRLDELQAALLRRVYLAKLPEWTEARRRIACTYLSGIRNPLLRIPGAPPGSESCWHLFPVHVEPERKAAFLAWLQSHAVTFGEHYPIAAPDQQGLAAVPFEISSQLNTARALCRSEVSLPIHPYLTANEIDQVIDVCNRWAG